MSETIYVQDGDILDHTAAADMAAGKILFKGALCLQVVTAAASGQKVGLRHGGVVRVTKASATVFDPAAGAKVYWNDTTKLAVLLTVAEEPLMGTAVGGGASGDLYVDVLLNA